MKENKVHEPETRIWLVSSYGPRDEAGERPIPVYPKSPATLDQVQRRIEKHTDPAMTSRVVARNPGIVRILVTGAGFDFQSRVLAAGAPDTAQVLKEMRPAVPQIRGPVPKGSDATDYRLTVQSREAPFKKPPDARSKFPEFNISAWGAGLSAGHRDAADNEGLDEYWDAALTAANLAPILDAKYAKFRDYADARGIQLEIALREAFRLSLAKYDIGHTKQSVKAAEGAWDAWLTTNYTRFGDRAIERLNSTSGIPWRRIATPIEAKALHTELILRNTLPLGNEPQTERLFVKLHGDISHVHTMAIATSDKKPRSRLAVTPDLGVMYAAATEWLSQRVKPDVTIDNETSNLPQVHWEVVGHGLRDAPLVEMIRRVIERSAPAVHEFTIVAPAEYATRIKDDFKKAIPGVAVKKKQMHAEDWS
jgi:hypothetical protein